MIVKWRKQMKKKSFYITLLAAVTLSLSACGGSGEDTEGALPAGGRVETEYGTVTLCDYSNLAADETHYEITDDDVEEEINNELYDYIQYVDKETAGDGDYVEVYMTGMADGELLINYSEDAGESYDILLGYNEFGEEFDEKLLGVAAGDELSFSITYADDYGDDEFAGLTVVYEVSVVSVAEEVLPELTEDFVVNTLGYASEEELRTAIREQLEDYYNSDTAYDTKEELLQLVVENSQFGEYSEELYASAKEDVDANYEGYAEWIGVSTVEEVYDAFEMTDEDVESEVLSQVYRTIAVYAIAQEQGLELTDDEYQAGLEEYAQMYSEYYAEEYTTDQLVSEIGEETLRYWILEDKVMDYLYDHATITQVTGSLDASYELDGETVLEDSIETVTEE
jgi:trigger factor